MSKQKPKRRKISSILILAIVSAVLISSTVGYALIVSMIPVNGKEPVFGFPENIYIKSLHTDQGFVFSSHSGAKKSVSPIHVSPVMHLTKDQLVTIHFMNEDKTSKHNFNIDQFGVHTKNLDYFQPESITFIADKAGTFRYHCTVHPEMSGEVQVQ